ncbi:MAG: HD domain-containing protein [bacterium]|nr:HD domain-containing protein [bacterium]MDE0289142.1 HD domain-containing protein [bacterium]MDE0438116.1 HD domain-containing protein [bacterium]
MEQLKRIDRRERERRERWDLSPAATRSAESKGREEPEEPDPLRTAFERDRDRIVHCNAIRRLARKTQVFIDPENDHFVTRLTHTLQVAQIGRAMAIALGLNEALTEAICLGHDIGHAPFGHTGEDALAEIVAGGWVHSDHSVRILSVLEPLNLTWEVLDGIRAHPWRVETPPATPEGYLCRFADRIAYLSHDLIDAMRADIIRYRDLPFRSQALLGDRHSRWVTAMVHAVVDRSTATGTVSMDLDVAEAMAELRAFMFERVYLRSEGRAHRHHAIKVVQDLVRHYETHPSEIPSTVPEGRTALEQAVDYVAGMTDRFASRAHSERCG